MGNQQFRDEMVAYKEKMAAYKLTPEFAAAKLAKKSKKAGKKPKDPNAPKRPMSGYFLFGNSVREQVQEELGTKDFIRLPDASTKCGRKPTKLSSRHRLMQPELSTRNR